MDEAQRENSPRQLSKLSKAEAIRYLEDAGAENVVREDEHGDTRSGWFMDTCFLSRNPVQAVQLLHGN